MARGRDADSKDGTIIVTAGALVARLLLVITAIVTQDQEGHFSRLNVVYTISTHTQYKLSILNTPIQ